MTFTKDQLEELSLFEEHFTTAVNASWSRHPGRHNLATIHRIFTSATGDTRRLDDNCQHCIVNLLRDCGRIYFADKATLAKKEEVKAEEIPVKKVRAKVKTKK